MSEAHSVTYLFSDIEGSTRLWEADPEGAARALAWHDRLSRATVERHHGTVVKMTGDGMHAAFDDPTKAVQAVLDLQSELARPGDGLPPLKVRCGLHVGHDQRRDNDFYGPAVNRAARISNAAHGGQVLLSGALVEQVRTALPTGAGLRELGLVRLKDLASPERLFQLTHPSLRADFPALRTLESTPNNLPQQLNSFVGREREMAEVRELLRKHRLVTLLAMGGVGKSRLSIQLGAEILDDFPDGVWLVELAPVAESADVPQAAATVLGVKEEPGGGVMESLARFVHERRLLLILDNCEHVVAGAAGLAKRLLQSGPGITVLASSRDPLQIAGECAYHLQTLAVPATNLKAEELEEHAAVRLFLDRALAVQPAFRLTDKVAGPVAEICRRLDGIPLALELAAARTRSLPVDVIAARLDQRFRLLATGDQTVLPRQRTLRALIDWSFDLLDERERSVFRRLSVFAGSLSLEAAEAVVPSDGMEAADVTDLLGSLVEKSLVAIDIEAGRYRLLETVRHYADEKLGESGERDAVRARYLAFFADLAEQARPHLTGPEQAHWLSRLDTERDNVLAAHDAGCALLTDVRSLVKIARGTRYYWFNRGQPSKGLQLYLDVLRLAGNAVSDADRCRLLFGAGQFEYYLGRLTEARGHLSECLDLAERTADTAVVTGVLQPLGLVCLDSGDVSSARRHLSAALSGARARDDQREVVGSLTALAMVDLVEGTFATATAELEEALEISYTTEDDESTAHCLINCAHVDVRNGELPRARARLLEAVDIARRLQSDSLSQYVLDGCLALAARNEDWASATTCYQISERLLRQMGRQRERADAAILQGAIDDVKRRPEFRTPEQRRVEVRVEDALAAARAALAG